MIGSPEVRRLPEVCCAALRMVVPRDEIRHVMGPAIREVFGAVQAQGLSPIGPWYTHHFRRPTDSFDLEVCVPVAGTIASTGRVYAGRRPAMEVVRTVYTGSYEGLGEAWAEFVDAIERGGHRVGDDLYEAYLVGPESNPNPEAWRTELIRPRVA